MVSEDRIVYSNQWFSIIERRLPNQGEPYFVLNTLDYVSIFARTIKEVLLVRQYRPVVMDYTLEKFPVAMSNRTKFRKMRLAASYSKRLAMLRIMFISWVQEHPIQGVWETRFGFSLLMG